MKPKLPGLRLIGIILTASSMALAGACSSSLGKNNGASDSSSLVIGAPIEVESSDAKAMTLLGPIAQTLLADNIGPLHVLAAGGLTEGDRTGGFVRISADSCLLGYARATNAVDDLDVIVFDDAGTSLVADLSVGPSPAVVICPQEPVRLYVMARASSGEGFVALGIHAVPPSQATAVADRLKAVMQSSGNEPEKQEIWPGVAREIERRREELSGRWTVAKRQVVPVGPHTPTYASAALPRSRCLDVLVVPNDDVRGLEIEVADDRGTAIARGIARESDYVALVCSPVDTTLTVEIRSRYGFGQAVVVLSRSEEGAESELAVRPDARAAGPMLSLDDVSLRMASALAAAHAPGRPQQPTVVARGKLRTAIATLHQYKLPAGCTRFDVLAGAPLAGIRAAVWEGNTLWARAEGGEQATLFGCADKPTEVEVEVLGQGRPGDYMVEARQEQNVPAVLRAHSVAAARLLGRLNDGGTVTPLSALRGVMAVDIDENNRVVQSITVPPHTCHTVIVSLGFGASGVGATAVVGREIVSRGYGSNVTTMRLCGDDKPMSAELRLTVAAGRTRALVGLLAR